MQHKEYVRQHYNQHVNPQLSQQEARAQREAGEAFPLKKLHNEIKRALINRFARGKETLLDLCCGRGGDIKKWIDAGLKYVRGVDISEAEVGEAARRFASEQQRYANYRNPPRELNLFAEFQVCTTLGEEMFEGDGPFDLVTIMFALHYFYESETMLRMLIKNVSYNLKPGGHFIATFPDAHRVMWHTKDGGIHNSRMLRIAKEWESPEHIPVTPFGNRYFFAISDTVTAGAGESQGSYEFLAFKTPLLRMAAHYGLVPVVHYDDPHLDSLFEAEDAHLPFKHFCPRFTPEEDPDLSMASASSTFVAIVFRKLEADERAPEEVPPLPSQLPPEVQQHRAEAYAALAEQSQHEDPGEQGAAGVQHAEESWEGSPAVHGKRDRGEDTVRNPGAPSAPRTHLT